MPAHEHNIAPMPTQNPWAWVGMGMGTQCWALIYKHLPGIAVSGNVLPISSDVNNTERALS